MTYRICEPIYTTRVANPPKKAGRLWLWPKGREWEYQHYLRVHTYPSLWALVKDQVADALRSTFVNKLGLIDGGGPWSKGRLVRITEEGYQKLTGRIPRLEWRERREDAEA